LSDRDRHLITAFHSVYRRNRLQQRQKGIKKCPDPNEAQLQEMRDRAQEQNIAFNSTGELLKSLKQVATQLRQYHIWSYRESLETYDSETGNYAPRADLPKDFSNEADELEGRELLIFLQESLKIALESAIAQALDTQIDKQKIRMLTVQQLLNKILEKAKEMGLTKIPPAPDYLKTVNEQIEAFADARSDLDRTRTYRTRNSNSRSHQQRISTMASLFKYAGIIEFRRMALKS
jgi:hypothetical protein